MKLLRRAYRKYESSGLLELAREAYSLLYEDHVLERYFLLRWLEDHRDVVVSEDELYGIAMESGLVLPSGEETRHSFPVKTSFLGEGSFDDVRTAEVRPPFLAVFEDAGVVLPAGLGVTSDGRLIEDTVIRVSEALAAIAVQNGLWWTKSRILDDPSRCLPGDNHLESATVMIPSYVNYYHWLIECVPRLRVIERFEEETGTMPTVIVPRPRPSWMDQTLSMAGVEDDIAAPDDDIVGVSQLLVPSRPQPTPGDLGWLRRRLADGIEPDRSDRRIMISRSDATRRRIGNRGELRTVLDELDIEEYVLSELTVREQVTLFSEAELVVAPHGAGLTNIVFGEDLSVVEFFGRKKSTTFLRLAAMLGHEYRPIFCDSDGLDIFVDPDRLRAVVLDTV